MAGNTPLRSQGTHVKYKTPITNHSQDMANFKLFPDRQMDKQAKHYMLPFFHCGDIKIIGRTEY
jgi:hypothetical protein